MADTTSTVGPAKTTGAPDGAESVTTQRRERQIIRLALKRYGNDLTREQRANTDKGVPNPAIVDTLTIINGTPGENRPGLIKRFMLDGDSDPTPEKANGKKKASDPNQTTLEVEAKADGKGKGKRGRVSDDAAQELKAAAESGN